MKTEDAAKALITLGVIGTGAGAIIEGSIALLSALGISIKGKTKHLGWNNADTITKPVAKQLDAIIKNDLSPTDYNLLNSYQFANEVIEYIINCNWWKQGNDQEVAVSLDVPAGNLQDTIWRVLLWAMDNAPLNNYSDAYYAINEVFSNTLYNSLSLYGHDDTNIKIDVIVASMAGMESNILSSAEQNNSQSELMKKLDNYVNSKIDSINSGTTGNTGGLFSTGSGTNNNVILIFAIIVGLILLTK
jgi:hypothetical protein